MGTLDDKTPEPCKSRYADAGLMAVSAEIARARTADAARRLAEAVEEQLRQDAENWDINRRESK